VQAYDRIEIPRITPDVTRVTLHGGACPCCHGRFKAAPPAGLAPGSPFGPNLRAFVLYLRFGQVIPFARLERLLLDLFVIFLAAKLAAELAYVDLHAADLARTELVERTAMDGEHRDAAGMVGHGHGEYTPAPFGAVIFDANRRPACRPSPEKGARARDRP
jgi:transposase